MIAGIIHEKPTLAVGFSAFCILESGSRALTLAIGRAAVGGRVLHAIAERAESARAGV